MVYLLRKEWAINLLSRIFGIKTILEIWSFFNILFSFLQKKKIQIKNGIYVLELSLKNVCCKFQLRPFRNVVFIAVCR